MFNYRFKKENAKAAWFAWLAKEFHIQLKVKLRSYINL